MKQRGRLPQVGLTLVELLVVVALVVIVIASVAPSFKRYVDTQRVSSTNSQVLTDMQLARSEAASRGARVRVTFRLSASESCYTIYTYASPSAICNCLLANPCGLAGPGYTEIKTTRVPRDTGVVVVPFRPLGPSGVLGPTEFAFEPLAGGLYTIPQDFAYDILTEFSIRTLIDLQRELRTVLSQSGRPSVCAPAGSKMREAAC